jgi:hypothetical protein
VASEEAAEASRVARGNAEEAFTEAQAFLRSPARSTRGWRRASSGGRTANSRRRRSKL